MSIFRPVQTRVFRAIFKSAFYTIDLINGIFNTGNWLDGKTWNETHIWKD